MFVRKLYENDVHTCSVILWSESLVLSPQNYAHLNVNIFSNFPFQMNADPNDDVGCVVAAGDGVGVHCSNGVRCRYSNPSMVSTMKVIMPLCYRCDCSFRNG